MTAVPSPRATMVRAFGYVGQQFTDSVVARLGALTLLVGRTARGIAGRSVRVRDVAYQVQAVGVRSLGLVVTMAAFAGMVLAFQFGYGLERFGAKLYIGQTTVTALVRELGPILTALVAGGRIGAGIAAELGGMAVTEQLDAVRALGADPLQRLVAPRILAVTLAMPLMTSWPTPSAAPAGSWSAGCSTACRRGCSSAASRASSPSATSARACSSRSSSASSSASSPASAGMNASGGTEGVGRATTRAVVAAALTVLATDFVLTKLMLTL